MSSETESDLPFDQPRIIPVVFTTRGEYGDFKTMIEDPRYEDSLFLFNDNSCNHMTALPGGGNAVIRPYNRYGSHYGYPRSAGIPTGYSSRLHGYAALTRSAQKAIDAAIREIEDLKKEFSYNRIFFSADPALGNCRPQLGTAIFQIGEDVRCYITSAIYKLGTYSGPDE